MSRALLSACFGAGLFMLALQRTLAHFGLPCAGADYALAAAVGALGFAAAWGRRA